MRRPLVGRAVAVIVLAGALGACGIGGPPHNVQLTVSNASAYPGTVHWVSPGLFGLPIFPSTGEEPLTGCSVYIRTFGPGLHTVSIATNGDSLELSLEGVSGSEKQTYVLIDGSGHPAETDLAAMPTTGCGHV